MVRLAVGWSRCEGCMVIQHNGTWGTMCDNLWGLPTTQGLCQQLGCGGALAAPRSSLFGDGSGPIFLDGVCCVRVAGGVGRERIHKEKNLQRAREGE